MDWLAKTLRSMSARLIALFTLALLPLGLIAISQTRQIVEEANSLASASLLARTISAASNEKSMIQEALGAVHGLAAVAGEAGVGPGCSEVMRGFLRNNPQYTFAGFTQLERSTDCMAGQAAVDTSALQAAIDAGSFSAPEISVALDNEDANTPVLVVRDLVRRDDLVLGAVTVALSLDGMDSLAAEATSSEPDLLLAIVDRNGNIIARPSEERGAESFLPAGTPLNTISSRVGETFPSSSRAGDLRHYAVASVIEGDVLLVGSWPIEEYAGSLPGLRQQTAILFPLLMWLVGIGVAYFGMRRLVVRHIQALRSAMRRFALGERSGKNLELDAPPGELADAERAFNRMALTIAEAEARREADLRDKEVLLKEVHHRVKNNLQLIASIMNMQLRSAREPETKRALTRLQQRVRGLAMLHRTLFTTPDVTTIDGAELIRTVVDDITKALGKKDIEITMSLDAFDLYPDQAVPLSMLLAEAIANAENHVGQRPDGQRKIDVTLVADDEGDIRTTVTNTLDPAAEKPPLTEESDGLGMRLMAAFVAQLEGFAEVKKTDEAFSYAFTFSQRGFEPEDPDIPA